MITASINKKVKELVPTFKIGLIEYKNITVSDSPQMLKGRFLFYQEEMAVNLEMKEVSSLPGINEWRKTFKKLGIDYNRYRPSSEALYKRIQKGNLLSPINSAVDLNNLLSLQYEIPCGVYDLNQVCSPIEIRLGQEDERYTGVNGRENNMYKKLVSADLNGAFGSPIVDAQRTSITNETSTALHIIYIRESMETSEAKKMLSAIANMFTKVHGGDASSIIIT